MDIIVKTDKEVVKTTIKLFLQGGRYWFTCPLYKNGEASDTGSASPGIGEDVAKNMVRSFLMKPSGGNPYDDQLLRCCEDASISAAKKAIKRLEKRVKSHHTKLAVGLIYEHRLTTAEVSYIGVLIAEMQLNLAQQRLKQVISLHENLMDKQVDRHIRLDKCQAVSEQVAAIQRDV